MDAGENLDQYLELTVLLPRALQTMLTISADISLFRLSRTLLGPSTAAYALSVHMLSWFYSYCASRSLANTSETSLAILGSAYLLPDTATDLHYAMGLFIAAISTFCRPTSACLWVTVVGYKLYTTRSFRTFFISKSFPIGLAVLEFCVAVDSACYGWLFTVTPWNFFHVNIALNYAAKFGVNSWHWNFTHGLPVILGLYFPLLLYGIFQTERKVFSRLGVVGLLVPVVYAAGLAIASPHQEYRFLLPCLPFLHMFLGETVQHMAHRQATILQSLVAMTGLSRVWKCVLLMAGVCHVIAAGFLLRYHQCGVERAFLFIGQDLRKAAHSYSLGNLPQVYVAAPCYSSPGYAFIYSPRYPLRLHLAKCLPGESSAYFDGDPSAYLKGMIAEGEVEEGSDGGVKLSGVEYVVTFDAYYSSQRFLNTTRELGFQEVAYFKHAYVRYDYDDPFPKYAVIVLRRTANQSIIESKKPTTINHTQSLDTDL
eukprot:gene32835-42512_t